MAADKPRRDHEHPARLADFLYSFPALHEKQRKKEQKRKKKMRDCPEITHQDSKYIELDNSGGRRKGRVL